ncbi:MAG: J domain-containing protein [Synergistaceae bacterium]|jgi:hypothetical protein|nr:J domain-containing protein [Synergistaceae bacterium]
MSASVEINRHLRVLGLLPGATAAEVRSAFRRLARTCHPDIAGRQSARKFDQIAGAYAFLKSLPPDELCPAEPGAAREPEAKPGRWDVWRERARRTREKWKGPLAWRRERRARREAEEERLRAGVRKEEERRGQARQARVDAALTRGEQALELLLERLGREARDGDAQALALRLRSEIPQVRRLALSRLGASVNRAQLFDAVADLLRRRDIDEKTARLTAALPFSSENRRKLARALAGRADRIPAPLLNCLLNLRNPQAEDKTLWELYLQNASPDGAILILRCWPKNFSFSVSVLRTLLSRKEEDVLIESLRTLKQRSLPCPVWARERLNALSAHADPVVRSWAKALLSP